MTTDINIFLPILSLSIILGVIGIWQKIPILMLIGGAIIAFMGVTIDLTNGSRVESIDTTTDINTVNWENDPVDVDVYPKIFVGLLGSMFMIAGALIWKFEGQ
jgi:hypothetical protein